MFEYDERRTLAPCTIRSPRRAKRTWSFWSRDPARVSARVRSGVERLEIGGGSIRTHRRRYSAAGFRRARHRRQDARERFGFFLDALDYGTPPHGGIALGLDRIVALIAARLEIREVIAFPKTASAIDQMCEAPVHRGAGQLKELGLDLVPRHRPVNFRCSTCGAEFRTVRRFSNRSWRVSKYQVSQMWSVL